MWFEIAAASTLIAAGNILFGHFEQGLPWWRRLLKLTLYLGLTALIAAAAGRVWALAWIAATMAAGLTVHFVWCRRHDIDPWRAEPRDRYYRLRGWTV